MKTLVANIAVVFLLSGTSLRAGENLHGDLLELHSCQLYIGGCIASSESPQDGRYLLRVWNFAGGSHDGTPLRGLQVALLETADENLAIGATQPNAAMAYLPQSATPAQAAALLDWLKSANPEVARMKLPARTVPMQFTSTRGMVFVFRGRFPADGRPAVPVLRPCQLRRITLVHPAFRYHLLPPSASLASPSFTNRRSPCDGSTTTK